MSLVKVTSKQRSGKPFAKDLLVDLSRITVPVFENISNDSVIVLNENFGLQNTVNQGNNNVQYIIDEDLATFIGLKTTEIFSGTVVERDGKSPVVTDMAFIASRIVGKIEEDPSGSKFLYEEQGGVTPIEYIVSETVSAINIALA